MRAMVALRGFAPETSPATRRRVMVVLSLAVLGISSSAVLVRGMEGIGPVTIAGWRCLGSALLLSPGIAAAWSALSRRDLAWTGVAGAFLGLHFAVWFASLSHTTVMPRAIAPCTVTKDTTLMVSITLT